MGNALLNTQKIVCGHTDRAMLRTSLLCDRISQPTAEMVDSLLLLQSQTVKLQAFAEEGAAAVSSDAPSRPLLQLAMGYCILFGYTWHENSSLESLSLGSSEGSEKEQKGQVQRGNDPVRPTEFLTAFYGACRQPQTFLQDLFALRAQVVTKEKLQRLVPLVHDDQVSVRVFQGPFIEVLQQLWIFLRSSVDCAQIYDEIRDCAASGLMDQAQAARMLDGTESDQRFMIGAMGDAGRFGDNPC